MPRAFAVGDIRYLHLEQGRDPHSENQHTDVRGRGKGEECHARELY